MFLKLIATRWKLGKTSGVCLVTEFAGSRDKRFSMDPQQNTRPQWYNYLPVEQGKCLPIKFPSPKQNNGVSPLSLNQNHLTVFGWRPAHWLTILELWLPPLDQFSGLAQVLYLVAFSVRYSTVRECVAWVAARTVCPNGPRPSLTRASALACSLEIRLVLSLWENTFSCASEAFLFRSYVLCHAFRASAQIASWAAH